MPEQLDTYAQTLPLDQLIAPTLDPKSHFLEGSANDAIAFFLTLDTINFGSGYFPYLTKRPGMSGYFTVATCLTERFRAGGAITPDALSSMTEIECRSMFQQIADAGPVDELMRLFARALNDLGDFVLNFFDGRFESLVAAADHSAEKLAEILSRMSLFQDVSRYDDNPISFYKRAQLTAADLNLALGGRGLGEFHDLDRLTIFADNLVPHVLRCDGVLRYEPDLARRIDASELLIAGSKEEIEIRACAVHAVELIVRRINARHEQKISPMQIDYLLWNRGQQPAYKARPRHRARCAFY